MSYLAPGAEAISEFARQRAGGWLNGTCVEASALMCAIALDPARFQMAAGDIGDALQRMVNEWRAEFPGDVSANGASNFVDAADWLRDQGLQALDDILPSTPDWFGEMQHGIPTGAVYLVGVTNAQALPGNEAGVRNHGLAALGVDDAGNIVCGDPDNWRAQLNMPGNPVGQLVTYTKQDFTSGAISSLTKVWRGPMVPTGWTDDGTTLKAPNGMPVVKGFRDWVLAHPWDADDYPLDVEHAMSQVEELYAAGSGTRQEFRKHLLCWVAARGVYEAWVGANLQAVETQLAAAQQQVADLTAQLAAAQTDPTVAAESAAFRAIKAALATT